MSRRRWGEFLGFLLTLLFGGLAIWRLDLRLVVSTLGQANYLLVPVAALFTLLGYILRTTRWRVILAPSKQIPVPRLFPVLVIGFAANNLLPARLGEFVRAYLLGTKEGISKSLSFATIVVERVLDGITLILLFTLVSSFLVLPAWGQQVGIIASVIFLGALLFLLLLLLRRDQALTLLEQLLQRAPPTLSGRAMGIFSSFVEGTRVLGQRRRFLPLAILSLAVWILEAGSYLVLTWAFALPLSLQERPLAALFVLALANLGILIPSSPGYIGTFHFFAMTALLAFRVEQEVALSYAVLSHATQYLLITGLGVFFLWTENLSLGRLRAQALGE